MEIFSPAKKLIFEQVIGEGQVIQSEIGIIVPGRAEVKLLALLDTGSTHSAITDDLVKTLNLKPVKTGRVIYGAIECEANIYHIDINLNGIILKNIIASDMPSSLDGIKFIIGMSVIRLGNFQIKDGIARFYLPDEEDESVTFSSQL
jgi:hypothetical protein